MPARRKVQLVRGWAIYVDGEERRGPDVIEVPEDLAQHLLERGTAVEVEKPKARRNGVT